jgi:hypothetical protein
LTGEQKTEHNLITLMNSSRDKPASFPYRSIQEIDRNDGGK